MKEYEFLRAEIMDDYKYIAQYNVVLYTASATILAFALQKEQFILSLVPYIILLPLYLMCEEKRRGICKIAAYLHVFLEGTEFNWERRHHVFDGKNNKNRKKSFFSDNVSPLPYYCLALVCSASAISKIAIYQSCWIEKAVDLSFVIMITIITIAIMNKHKTDYVNTRDRYIKYWEEQKKSEEKPRENMDFNSGEPCTSSTIMDS